MNRFQVTALLSALVALFVLHLCAMANHWYVEFGWFDIPMHFLGGASIAMSVQYIWLFMMKRPCSFGKIVILTFIATIAWELFESYYNIAGAQVGTMQYYRDSIKDIIVGTIGGMLVAEYNTLVVKIHEKNI